MGTPLPPEVREPPYIQTNTGFFAPADFAPVQTFKYRQSSLIGSLGIKNSSVHILTGTGLFCIGLGSNTSHVFMPAHGFMAFGAFHRSSPMGGKAKGMPLKDKIPDLPLTPLTIPSVVFTVVEIGSDISSFGIGAKKLNSVRKHTGTVIPFFIIGYFVLLDLRHYALGMEITEKSYHTPISF